MNKLKNAGIAAAIALIIAAVSASGCGGKTMSVEIERKTCAAPLRAINGDIYPTDIASVRLTKPDFDAVVMKHMGHYPMLERPDEFNRLVAAMVASLTKQP